MFEQGKKGYYGVSTPHEDCAWTAVVEDKVTLILVQDGSPAGFVAIVMDSAKVSRPQNGWGQVVYEQEGASTLKKYDEVGICQSLILIT